MTTTLDSMHPADNTTMSASATATRTVRALPVENLGQSVFISQQSYDWPSWLPAIYERIRSWIDKGEYLEPRPVMRCLQFLRTLRHSTARPFVALGDDGSVAAEWDHNGDHLNVTFSDEGDEAFWLGADGAEWESPLADSTDRLDDAIQRISAT